MLAAVPTPIRPKHLPSADVLAFIISLSRVYGVLPGIGSHADAVQGRRSSGSLNGLVTGTAM
jgi:hypothetical protein